MSTNVEQRIKNVINNLRPATAFKDRYDSPRSLDEQMLKYHTPGASLAVINDFEIEWARGFGYRQAGLTPKVTPETLFQAGSISKPVFALAVMRLVQEGRLDPDEDINTYLTSWQVPANEDWQPRLTLRQLLSHTAGLTVHGFPGYHQWETVPTIPQILNGEPPANTPKIEVNILPGLQFRYSGGGTTVAQQLLVDLLGQPFPELMHELVLEPLGMTHSTYQQPLPDARTKDMATAHPWKGLPLTGKYHIYPEMAAAGLWSTATDLAKVGLEMLRILRGEFDGLLTKKTVEAMLQPQLKDQSEGDEYCGLGFFCSGKDDAVYLGHSGWDEGFVAMLRVHKTLGKGVVIMLNSNEGHPLLEEIMRAVAQEYDWPDVFPEAEVVVDLPHSEQYAGDYVTEAGQEFRLSVQDGQVQLQIDHQPVVSLWPTSETEFFAKVVEAQVTFEKNDNGQIKTMTLSQGGKQFVAERQTNNS